MKRTLQQASPLIFGALLLFCSLFAHSQVSPFMGLGNAQFFDNNGKPLTVGVLYSYQAGTSTQQATYTDFTGLVPNPNPIPFGSGARVSIWLTSGAFYKFVLCSQNDGAFCSPGDVLFSVDQVPGSASGSSGSSGGGAGTFTGTFITGSANPATTGILELASGDALCWRNAAGTANLCISKDSSDVLAWAGGAVKIAETACGASGVGFDYLCASNSNHRLLMSGNGGSQVQLAAAGVDINTSDQVTQLHFGATPAPINTGAPTANQVLQWNGSSIVGYSEQLALQWCSGPSSCAGTVVFAETGGGALQGTETVFATAHNVVRFTFLLTITPTGCSTPAVIGVKDFTSGTTLYSQTLTNALSTGFIDSGVIAVPTTATDKIVVGTIQAAAGCSVFPQFTDVVMLYH